MIIELKTPPQDYIFQTLRSKCAICGEYIEHDWHCNALECVDGTRTICPKCRREIDPSTTFYTYKGKNVGGGTRMRFPMQSSSLTAIRRGIYVRCIERGEINTRFSTHWRPLIQIA